MSEPMSVRVRVKAPVADVHHALTDPDALRTWLAEHAEVKPDRYEFWGRYTPDGDEPHQRLLHVDDRTLRFSWRLDGEDTTVEFALEAEEPDSTIVTLSHTCLPAYLEMVTGTGTKSLMHTFWALSIANLVDHVEGRALTPKCDFTSPVMREQVTIATSPQAVYDSLVNPEEFSRWFGAHIEAEPRVGGRFAMGHPDPGQPASKIVELEPGRKMSIAWTETMVSTWELEDAGGGTRLTFVQSGFDDGSYGAWMGNLAGLAEMRRYHELPDWRPIRLSVYVDGLPDGLIELG
jgi:uncharacterized protein YndB with AHSA1/START domain